jgi:hypothetical protein
MSPGDQKILGAEAKLAKDSLNDVRDLLSDTQSVQSSFDKLYNYMQKVNWEECFSDLGNYKDYVVKTTASMVGLQNELDQYQKLIESSYANARKATEEAEKASKAATQADRDKYLELAGAYRIKAAEDMKKAETAYAEIYQKAPAESKKALEQMNAAGQNIAGQNNTLAAAAEVKARKVNSLGKAVMKAKYILNSNQTDGILKKLSAGHRCRHSAGDLRRHRPGRRIQRQDRYVPAERI